MTRATAFVGTVFLALHLLSCSRFRSARQCETLIHGVNAALDDVEATPGRNPPTVAAYKAIGVRYDRLARDLEKLKFTNVMLSRIVDDYRRLCVTTARNAQVFAEALKTNDAFKLSAVRGAAAQAVRKEKMLVRRMDAICQP